MPKHLRAKLLYLKSLVEKGYFSENVLVNVKNIKNWNNFLPLTFFLIYVFYLISKTPEIIQRNMANNVFYTNLADTKSK